MSEFAFDTSVSQVGVEVLVVEAAVFVQVARTRSRRVTKEGGVAIKCGGRLPRCGASGEGRVRAACVFLNEAVHDVASPQFAIAAARMAAP